MVATALTVYGIETLHCLFVGIEIVSELQQHLPFTVLKLIDISSLVSIFYDALQQHLPFTVLKRSDVVRVQRVSFELQQHLPFTVLKL